MKTSFTLLLLFIAVASFSQDTLRSLSFAEREAIILEHGNTILNKWYNDGVPAAYADPFAAEITYFDPTNTKIRKKEELVKHLEGGNTKGTYTGVQHVFQHYDNVTVHTLNYGEKHSGVGWNGTEVYHWKGVDWEIVHAHWSFTDPLVVVKDFKKVVIYASIPGIITLFLTGWFLGKRMSKKPQPRGE